MKTFSTLGLVASLIAVPAFAAGPEGEAAVPAKAQAHPHRHGGDGQNRDWTRYPLIAPMMARGGDRTGAKLGVKNIDAPALNVYAPAGTSPHWEVPLTPQGARVQAAPKIGNFYWVSAREATEGHVGIASTLHFFSNPGPAPTALLLVRKNELEIIPQPLPREHSSYRENEEWPFLVRFNGQPVAGKQIILETEYGTRASFTSGPDGMVKVKFPHDFKPVKEEEGEGHHGPRRAKFVLAAEHAADGTHYVTAFNYSYGPDAYAGKNLWAGAGFGIFGMLLATPLLRRRKSANTRAEGEQ